MAKLFMVASLREEGAERPEACSTYVGRSVFKGLQPPLHFN